MKRIGLTGGIGSGKTIISRIFRTFGIPVFNADETAKTLMNTNPEIREELKQTLGETAYNSDNTINKTYLRNVLFNDKETLNTLNKIVHPYVINRFEEWYTQLSAPYAIKEAAILFESGAYKYMDRIITVFAPVELRIKRIMQRDGTTRENVLKIIENQLPDEEKMKQADYIIYNNGRQMVIPQVMEIHKQIKNS